MGSYPETGESVITRKTFCFHQQPSSSNIRHIKLYIEHLISDNISIAMAQATKDEIAPPKVETDGDDNMHNGTPYQSPSVSKQSDKNDVLVMSEDVLNSITKPSTNNVQSIWNNDNSPKSTSPQSLNNRLRQLSAVSISSDKSDSSTDDETVPLPPIPPLKMQEFRNKINKNLNRIKNSRWNRGDVEYQVTVSSNNKVYMVRKHEGYSYSDQLPKTGQKYGDSQVSGLTSKWQYRAKDDHDSSQQGLTSDGTPFTRIHKAKWEWRTLSGDATDPQGLNELIK